MRFYVIQVISTTTCPQQAVPLTPVPSPPPSPYRSRPHSNSVPYRINLILVTIGGSELLLQTLNTVKVSSLKSHVDPAHAVMENLIRLCVFYRRTLTAFCTFCIIVLVFILPKTLSDLPLLPFSLFSICLCVYSRVQVYVFLFAVTDTRKSSPVKSRWKTITTL